MAADSFPFPSIAVEKIMAEELGEEELLAWRPRLGALSVADKLAQGETLKLQANLLVKRGELRRALRSYAQVFAYVNGLSVQGDAMAQYAAGTAGMSATAREGEQIEALKVAAWANMALCHVRLGSPEKAIEACDKVLAVNDKHSKAQFRKAQALAQLQHYERALALLAELLAVEPGDAAVRRETRRVQQLKKAQDAAAREAQKAAYADMFAKKR